MKSITKSFFGLVLIAAISAVLIGCGETGGGSGMGGKPSNAATLGSVR